MLRLTASFIFSVFVSLFTPIFLLYILHIMLTLVLKLPCTVVHAVFIILKKDYHTLMKITRYFVLYARENRIAQVLLMFITLAMTGDVIGGKKWAVVAEEMGKDAVA